MATIKLTKCHETSWLWYEPEYNIKHSRVVRAQAENMINNGGMSTHSQQAATLKVMLSYLEDNLIPYTLTAIPGKGYVVEVDREKAQQALHSWSNQDG